MTENGARNDDRMLALRPQFKTVIYHALNTYYRIP